MRAITGLFKNHWPVLLIVAALLALDQGTKYLVTTNISPGQSIPAEGFFRITFVYNTGSAFGLFVGQNTALTAVSFLGVGVLLWFYRTHSRPDQLFRLSLGLMLAGALGNLADRLTVGRVIDFIDVGPWPIFNVADSSIVVGGIVLGWILLTNSGAEPEEAGEEATTQPLAESYTTHDRPHE